ncbi:enoyl-CoA hydratase/isomerase family protein [Moraxella sp. ZJ142]|uniref:enoyl-CoA hydratase/isomerase family protein n=1 Tax=Moraxella marmotae TaxID=3344520 RepID=UPI0035D41186
MSIITDFLPINEHQRIGTITLNKPEALNAQNLEMVRTTKATLQAWADDDSVVAVLLRGAGERAFCAGGDIRNLYHSYDPSVFPNPMSEAFFGTEYDLCKQINSYAKPIIVWASGIVMGGGMGLAMPSSHVIVTDTTMMAMPEVSIGLFPDAGGSYFLTHIPDKIGLFLGLTGARFNGIDALALGLADFGMPSDAYDKLLLALTTADWQADSASNHQMLNTLLNNIQNTETLGDGWLLPHRDTIAKIAQAESLAAFDRLAKSADNQPEYLKKAFDSYNQGSPTSASLAWQLHHLVGGLDFDAVMDMEYIVALHCSHNGEFFEGVRALLIDKDKNPAWRYTLDTMPDGYIDSHFQAW